MKGNPFSPAALLALAAVSKSAHVDADDSTVGLYSDHYPVLCALQVPTVEPWPDL